MASWTAPEDNGGRNIAKYYYQYVTDDGDGVAEPGDFTGAASRSPAVTVADGTTDDAMTTHTLEIKSPTPALSADTVYVFRVAAVNKDPDSSPANADRPDSAANVDAANWSTPILFSTSEAAKPNAVEGLTSELATDASGNNRGVNLLWNKPSGGAAPAMYDVEVQDEHGDWVNPTDGKDLPATRTSYTDDDEPDMDEMRVYRVRASNGAGDGPWTMVYYPRGPADDHTHDTRVMAPTNVMATSDGTGELTLTWEGGENADFFLLIAVDLASVGTGSLDYDRSRVNDPMATTGDVTGLNSGSRYLGIVIAVKSDGTFAHGTATAMTVQ